MNVRGKTLTVKVTAEEIPWQEGKVISMDYRVFHHIEFKVMLDEQPTGRMLGFSTKYRHYHSNFWDDLRHLSLA